MKWHHVQENWAAFYEAIIDKWPEAEDTELMGRMFLVAKQLAATEGLAEAGYRTVFNCNEAGGQAVYHIHLHLVGGEPLGPLLSL